MRTSSILISGAVAAVAVAGSAMASTVIYDSTSMYAAGTQHPTPGAGTVQHATQAYWASQATEYGGKVGFAGTARLAQSATVQFRSGGTTPGPGDVTMSLNFYSLNGDGTVGGLLGSREQTFSIPGGDPSSPNFWQTRPWFDVTFDLSSLNLTLPDQVAYGVSFNANQNATSNSLNINMWNYGTNPSWSAARLVDGPQVKTGTELGAGTWGRRYNGGGGYVGTLITHESIYAGQFTPAISISAVPAPGAIALLGMAGLVGRRRRS